MLSAKEAQERILERISVLDSLELAAIDAHGCVLAETVTAPEDLPAYTTAAVDGFALRAEDTSSASSTPRSLTIIGDAGGGKPFAGRVAHGETVRISAGAAMPEGADAIVRSEDVAVVGSSMAIGRILAAGENVRPSGGDIAKGEVVMNEGQRIRGMDVGVLAALGRARATVRPRPRVVVFSTGDELREPGQPVGPGLVRDANSFALAGMTREAGSEPTRAGIVSDDPGVLREKFQSFLPQADVFVTTGGVADGDNDNVRDVVSALGSVEHWQLSASPASTLAFGSIEGRPFFGLPGDPVACVVSFELFVRPALLKMAGRTTLYRPEVEATIEEACRPDKGRQTYFRTRAWRDGSGWRARMSGKQGENIVSSVSGANALAIVPSDQVASAGDTVRLLLLEPLEGW